MVVQIRIVDAYKVRVLKEKAKKDMHQNCSDTRLRGLTVKETLQALGLWEGGGDDKERECRETASGCPNAKSE